MNYWGIDFGTTNSALFGYIQNPHTTQFTQFKIMDSNGAPFSSVVAIDRMTEAVFVGAEAKARYYAEPEKYEFITSIKMALEDDAWRCVIKNKVWTAVDVAAEILKALKYAASKMTYRLHEVVIAVPNGASGKMKQKLHLAAEKVGLKIVQFITEPTAAFFANYNHLSTSRYVVVFDWGGGTLDITVLECKLDGTIVERAKRSSNIAGDKIDEALAFDIHRQLMDAQKTTKTFNQMSVSARGALLKECEYAKQVLNDGTRYGPISTWVQCLAYDGIVVNQELTRAHFDRITEQYVNNAMQLLQATLDDAHLSARHVNKVLVVGGSSKLTNVRLRICEYFSGGDCILFPQEAEWNIAMGAARISYNGGKSYSAEDIGIILGDSKGSFFPLLRGYHDTYGRQALESYASKNSPKKQSFGIMDTSQYPRIVFALRDEIGKVSVLDQTVVARAYGFLREQIILESLVDGGQSFCVRIQSNHASQKDAMYWEYSKLNIVYEKPRF